MEATVERQESWREASKSNCKAISVDFAYTIYFALDCIVKKQTRLPDDSPGRAEHHSGATPRRLGLQPQGNVDDDLFGDFSEGDAGSLFASNCLNNFLNSDANVPGMKDCTMEYCIMSITKQRK